MGFIVVQKRWTFGLTAVAAVLVAGGVTVVRGHKPAPRSSESALRLGAGSRHDWNAG